MSVTPPPTARKAVHACSQDDETLSAVKAMERVSPGDSLLRSNRAIPHVPRQRQADALLDAEEERGNAFFTRAWEYSELMRRLGVGTSTGSSTGSSRSRCGVTRSGAALRGAVPGPAPAPRAVGGKGSSRGSRSASLRGRDGANCAPPAHSTAVSEAAAERPAERQPVRHATALPAPQFPRSPLDSWRSYVSGPGPRGKRAPEVRSVRSPCNIQKLSVRGRLHPGGRTPGVRAATETEPPLDAYDCQHQGEHAAVAAAPTHSTHSTHSTPSRSSACFAMSVAPPAPPSPPAAIPHVDSPAELRDAVGAMAKGDPAACSAPVAESLVGRTAAAAAATADADARADLDAVADTDADADADALAEVDSSAASEGAEVFEQLQAQLAAQSQVRGSTLRAVPLNAATQP